jgi:ribokinase
VVVGSVNADLVLESRLPLPGETIAATAGGVIFPGGKGANQAAAAARLGCSTAFVGQTGKDAAAGVLRDALTGCGVSLDHLAAVDKPTGQAVIILQPGGENSIILVPGANADWAATPSPALDTLAHAKMLLLQREVPEAVSLCAARAAAKAGVPIVLDAGGDDSPVCGELLGLVTYLSPNETELARLSGRPTDGGEDQVLAAALALQQTAGVQNVLVKLGAHGCLLVPPPPGTPLRQLAFAAEQVVDTTGAGDCFTAAFAVGILEGMSASEAMRFASAAACLCVQKMGAMSSLPARAEVEALLASAPPGRTEDFATDIGVTIKVAFQ